jgi:hypothetical protein
MSLTPANHDDRTQEPSRRERYPRCQELSSPITRHFRHMTMHLIHIEPIKGPEQHCRVSGGLTRAIKKKKN